MNRSIGQAFQVMSHILSSSSAQGSTSVPVEGKEVGQDFGTSDLPHPKLVAARLLEKGPCFCARSTQKSPFRRSILENLCRPNLYTLFSPLFFSPTRPQTVPNIANAHSAPAFCRGSEPCPMVILRFRDAERRGGNLVFLSQWLHKSCPCMFFFSSGKIDQNYSGGVRGSTHSHLSP